MGRKPATQASEEMKAMDLVAQEQKEHELSIQEVDKRFLDDGEVYNLHICLSRAKAAQEQMASGMLEMGKQLVLIKHHEQHGNFLAVLEKLGLAERSAQYAMIAANKFSNPQTTADLGNEKIRALTVLDDDSIKTLEDGGEYAGMTLDDIERMTVRELKENLRKEREERKADKEAAEKRIKAVESVVKSKEEKLTELEIEVENKVPPTAEQLAQNELDALRKDFMGSILAASYEVDRALETLRKAQAISGVTLFQLETFIHRYDDDYAALCENNATLEEALQNICPDKPQQGE